MEINDLTREIIGAAMKVHSALGPGLLESAHRACLVHELRRRGFRVRTEVPLPLVYDEVHLDVGYRIDTLVEERVLLELKAIRRVAAVFQAQALSYIKLGGYPAGLLINFHVVHLRNGITRLVNSDATK